MSVTDVVDGPGRGGKLVDDGVMMKGKYNKMARHGEECG